jgi:hypothetical protein
MSSQCNFRDNYGRRCTDNVMNLPDIKPFSICNRMSGKEFTNNPSLQVYYPTKPSLYCYYHDKLMKGLMDDSRGKSHKAKTISHRY